ncbi:MAG: FAD/NAD(P)-binding protein [Actinomycetota bacterium]
MIESDYVVVGAGAMGMAFVDTILTETDATVTLLDRRARPGGHWNVAYPFVRLHQPSAFYGVPSAPLGSGTIDGYGWNEGLYELASGPEVVGYFDTVLRERFLPSGRVTFLPMTDYRGGDRAVSLLTGEEVTVRARRRFVDATYMDVSVPAMRPPAYEVAPEVLAGPVNRLGELHTPPDRYVIVGAGKTGADACLWLLANGTDPDRITWIMPRDSWYLDRSHIQPGQFADRSIGLFASQSEHLAASTSITDLFERLESSGSLLRLDPAVTPTMYRCSTVTVAELEQLKRIERVVRAGRVRKIGPQLIELDDGIEPTTPSTFHVDCSADGLARRPPVPIFTEGRLTLQAVRQCQQVFSAALIAKVEALDLDDDERNARCGVVPHPDRDTDWIRAWLDGIRNTLAWRSDESLTAWLTHCRLDPFSRPEPPSAEAAEAFNRTVQVLFAAIERAEAYVEELDRLEAEPAPTPAG